MRTRRVTPVLTWLRELVVADPSGAPSGANAGLLQRCRCCAGDIAVDKASPAEAELVGAQQRIDDAAIRRGARTTAEEDPPRGTRVELWFLAYR
jgi:hypothetical protein